MTKLLKTLIVVLFVLFATINYSSAQQWSAITNNNIWNLNTGNVGIGVTSPQGILQVRGTYDNSWIYFSSNAGMNSTKYKPKVTYGLAFNWNYSGGQEESIINYSGSSAARLDFTSFDGTNLITEMTLKKGSLGIGTTTPSSVLQIVKSDATTNQNLSNTAALDIWNSNSGANTGGQINFRSDANSGPAGIGAVIGYSNISSNSAGSAGNLVFGVKNAATDGSVIPAMTIQHGGNVGIGTISPLAKLEVISNKANSSVIQYKSSTGGLLGKIWETGDNSSLITQADNTGSENIILQSEGVSYFKNAIKIGTSGIDPTNAMLTVNGTIHAKEVDVDVNIPADYVFKSDYNLMPLNDVEKYVKTNSHLPEIPSAEEITKNGFKMGEMQNKLLQKVEELTLYVIEQQKEIDQLKKELKK